MKQIIFSILIFLTTLTYSQTPTKQELYDEIVKMEFTDPMAVWKIVMWESGALKSEICRTRHNLFGLRSTQYYMRFESWKECLTYFKKLESRKLEKYKQTHNGDYWDFICWWGFKTGKSYSPADRKFVETVKNSNFKL